MTTDPDLPGLHIGGVPREGGGTEHYEVRDPATGRVVSSRPEADVRDVDDAVRAAHTSFADWSRTTPAERSTLLSRWAAELDTVAAELADIETLQAGKPIRLSSGFDVPGSIDNVAFFAGAARNLEGRSSAEYSPDHTSSIRREPIGVIGSIAPWNYPLQMAVWKILPAVAAGNTVVLKPAEITPLTSVMLADAATRAYVQRSRYDEFVAGVATLMDTVIVGAPGDPATDQGPLVSRRQQQHVAGFVERARADGARVVRGGAIPGGKLAEGYYYEPTLIVDADQRSEIVQQEVFGPVLVVLPFDDDAEAIALANDTPYGLAASAWTRDVYRAQTAAREIAAGCVWINDHIPIISEMPHGGYKASGYGKDMSTYSFEEYTVVKHVMSDITGIARKDWHRTVFGR